MSTKKILAFVLALALALTMLTVAVAEADDEVVGGRYNGMTWSYDPSVKTLTISCNGVLPSEQPMPWSDFAAEIEIVIFRTGVTSIPNDFLLGCVNLKQIIIPATVTYIGTGVLTVSGALTDIIYEGDMDALLALLNSDEDRAIAKKVGKQGTYNPEDASITWINKDSTMKTVTTTVTKDTETTEVEYKDGTKVTIKKYLKKDMTEFDVKYKEATDTGVESVWISAQGLWDEIDKEDIAKLKKEEKILDGEIKRINTFDDGKTEEIVRKYKNNKVVSSSSVTKDEKGRTIEKETRKTDSKTQETTQNLVIDNDDGSREEQKITSWKNGNTKEDKTVSYDENNKVTNENVLTYDKGEEEIKSENTDIEYHDNGKKSKEIKTVVDSEEQTETETTIEYDKKGKKKSETKVETEFYDDDVKSQETTTIKDKNGKTETTVDYNKDGSKKSESILVYDKDSDSESKQIEREYHEDKSYTETVIDYSESDEGKKVVKEYDKDGNEKTDD